MKILPFSRHALSSIPNRVRTARIAGAVAAGFALVSIAVAAHGASAGESLIDFERAMEQGRITAGDRASVSLTGEDNGVLELRATRSGGLARVDINAPEEVWDLSRWGRVNFQVFNPGDAPVVFYGSAANPEAELLMDNSRNGLIVMPGERRELRLRLTRRPEDPGYTPFRSFYMYYRNINVRDNTVDPGRIAMISAWLDSPAEGQAVHIERIRPAGDGEEGPVEFFPFADEFGQYRHSDWPGKIHNTESFAERLREEEQEMADWPGPSSWNEWGGWKTGPRLDATGFFRVEKYNDKWWLVDPDGYLFWSHGPTGVGYGGDLTPITDREHWFAALPDRDGPLGRFYGTGRGATYMYYENREWEGYDFGRANLYKKFGDNAGEEVARRLHDRLRSWGFNTMANWSAPDVYLLRRTPYTVAIHAGGPSMHYRMRDIYHPDWLRNLRQRMERERGTSAGDPWNLGYFVDNELWWGWRPRAASVGLVAIAAGPEVHSKRVFVDMLRERYESIDDLNAAWETEHASWDTLMESREGPNPDVAQVIRDCGDFGMKFAEFYFSNVRNEVKRVAPDNMYLGVRFHGHIDPALVALCADYADVVSYNVYDNPPAGRLNQYLHLDVPIISGEWGIRSNPLHTPFRGDHPLSPDPQERSQSMERYLESGFRHPLLVGAHFFQFRDQPLTGRPDGEGIPRGLVNITDTPHFDLVQTNRRLAYNLYERRYGGEYRP